MRLIKTLSQQTPVSLSPAAAPVVRDPAQQDLPVPGASGQTRKLLGLDAPSGPAVQSSRDERLARVEALMLEAYDNGSTPIRVAAPGRVNLIGEHLDYNDGFVFPAAIDRSFVGAFQQRDDDKVVIRSLNQSEPIELSLSSLETEAGQEWGEYVRAVAQALRARGVEVKGMHGVIDSDVPIGSGLSSSAALELLIARAFARASGVELSNLELVKIAQQAESEFVGVKCGIMDQFAIGMGKKGCALLLDTRSLDAEAVRIDLRGYKVVIGNTKKKRSLVDSAFNERREQCEQALAKLRELSGLDLKALRDVTPELFAQHAAQLPSPLRERAQHVIEENDRVLAAVEALKLGRPDSLKTFGQLMNQSHASLRDLYQVSCKELDAMVSLAQSHEGVAGSRMTGAGFGGCTVSLVRADQVEDFIFDVGGKYQAETGLTPEFYVCSLEDGLMEVQK